MGKLKIGISIRKEWGIAIHEAAKILNSIGFDAISPPWENEDALSEAARSAKENGLILQSLHAPFKKAADLWSNNPKISIPAKNEILTVINACEKYGIPILVLHAWIGFDYKFDSKSLNFHPFDEIVSFAQEKNIKIAFENTEGEEYLFALMDHFKDHDTVRFCWDSGHEMCYNHSMDLLSKYGDRLIVTHLNDNLGISHPDGKIFWTDDLHLLPYDGIADWDQITKRLKKANKLDILNFELCTKSKPNRDENDSYGKMSLEDYFSEVYKRACMIAKNLE